ncbi:MAG: 50S ribosome-binding GTPase [Candidatus Altiarchaeota archaeon]|nr:50S ribosome-binding GTPase [Candidatus Altiarchaeota archaeon]
MSPNMPSRTMDAYERYVSAKNDEERIRYLEEYLGVIPKHKGTEKERGKLRRKLALLRESAEKRGKSGGSGRDINVKKEGAAQIVVVGFPNVGKSSLLCEITNADSKVADYAFTTLEPIVGMMPMHNVRLQIVDLPGLISGASEDKGMGKRFLTVIRNSDVLMIMLDVRDRPLERLERLLREFSMAGLRLNKEKPDVKIYKKDSGGIEILGEHLLMCDLEDAVESLRDFSILNASVRINRKMGLEDFIDAIDKSVVWKKALVVLNKTDLWDEKETQKLANKIRRDHGFVVIPISAKQKRNIERLKQELWNICGLMCVYTVTSPDSDPLVIPKGSTILDAAMRIHSDFAKKLKYARVWGKSARYGGQRVGREHVLQDGDIIELNA